MKTKFFKILAPIVAFGLLVGALVGISASANEAAPAAASPEIISMNVEYGSELYLYYAVDKSTVSGTPSLEVLSDKDGSSVEYVVTEYTEEKVNGKDSYIFKTVGVAAADVNKVQFVRAADGDVKGAIREASVEMYLYAKLYKEGFALKTAADGDDFVRRNLYFQLLSYAKFAQELFYYGTDYEAIGAPGIYAKDAEGIVNGKLSSDYTILKSAKEGFSYWKVDFITPYGEAVETRLLGNGYELLDDGNSIVATPVYNAESMDGVEIWDASVLHFNYIPENLIFGTANATKDVSSIVVDPTDPTNRVLQIACNGKTHNIALKANAADIPADANAVIGEVKIYLGGKDSNGNGYIGQEFFLGIPGTSHYTSHYSFFVAGNGKINVYKASSSKAHSSAKTITSSNIKYNEWVTFRFEYRVLVDEETGLKTPEWKFFINDEPVGTWESLYGYNYQVKDENGNSTGVLDQSKIPDPKSITYFSLNTSSSNKQGFVYFDDYSIKHIVE